MSKKLQKAVAFNLELSIPFCFIVTHLRLFLYAIELITSIIKNAVNLEISKISMFSKIKMLFSR